MNKPIVPPYVPGGSAMYVPPADEFRPGRHHRTVPTWVIVLGALAMVVVVAIAVVAGGGEPDGQLSGPRIVGLQSPAAAAPTTPPAVEPTTAPTTAVKAPPPAVKAAATVGAGVWVVPGEVKPGTYTTTGEGFNCYWARLKDVDGELDSIIANGNLGDGERGRIKVKASDRGLELNGDCTWTRVG